MNKIKYHTRSKLLTGIKKIILTTLFCIISALTFGQNIPNIYSSKEDLNRKVFEHVLIKESMDSNEVKIGDFPIFVIDLASKKRYSNEKYSICRISTLSSPDYYLIVIIENDKYTFIDLDKEENFNTVKRVVESFKNNNISKKKMLLYLSELIDLIEYKNKDTIRM